MTGSLSSLLSSRLSMTMILWGSSFLYLRGLISICCGLVLPCRRRKSMRREDVCKLCTVSMWPQSRPVYHHFAASLAVSKRVSNRSTESSLKPYFFLGSICYAGRPWRHVSPTKSGGILGGVLSQSDAVSAFMSCRLASSERPSAEPVSMVDMFPQASRALEQKCTTCRGRLASHSSLD